MDELDNTILIAYNKLWKLLVNRNMNKTQLKDAANVSSNVIDKMGRDEPVAIESLLRCPVLGVDIGDIISLKLERVEE